jgi:hypothetical protein
MRVGLRPEDHLIKGDQPVAQSPQVGGAARVVLLPAAQVAGEPRRFGYLRGGPDRERVALFGQRHQVIDTELALACQGAEHLVIRDVGAAETVLGPGHLARGHHDASATNTLAPRTDCASLRSAPSGCALSVPIT